MRILHLIAGDLCGGAARGAYWLHKGLLCQGMDSKIITNSNATSEEADVFSINRTRFDLLLNKLRISPDILLPSLYQNRKKRIFSTSFAGYNFTKSNLYKWADIVHLHWINAGLVNVRHLSKVTKPIVWTLRDMWPMTGGCHYAMECKNYLTHCNKCPQLGSNGRFDLSYFVFKRKQAYYPSNMTFVGISNWLSELAKNSNLLHRYHIETILNNVDVDNFFPVDKIAAKNALGLSSRKKVILVGATRINDFYKGFDRFVASLDFLEPDKYLILYFGKLEHSIANNCGFEFITLGYLNDSISLRMAYSAADVFVAPSIYEGFGKTLAESMACGTPVVCFDATGPRDIVDHKMNGYRAIPYESADLAKGVEWVVHSENYNELCVNARQKAAEKFANKVVAQQYIALYNQILQNHFTTEIQV